MSRKITAGFLILFALSFFVPTIVQGATLSDLYLKINQPGSAILREETQVEVKKGDVTYFSTSNYRASPGTSYSYTLNYDASKLYCADFEDPQQPNFKTFSCRAYEAGSTDVNVTVSLKSGSQVIETATSPSIHVTVLEDAPLLFFDVRYDHENIYALEYLKEKGIIAGYDTYAGFDAPADPEARLFLPYDKIRRSELTKIVVFGQNIRPDPGKYKNCFKDVTDQWFAAPVCYAKEQGWVAGYPDGNFRPGQEVNLVEALKIMEEAYGMPHKSIVIDANHISDAWKNQWFLSYMLFAYEFNILGSSGAGGGGAYYLNEKISRATTSEYLYRIIRVKPFSDIYSSTPWEQIPLKNDLNSAALQYLGLVPGKTFEYEILQPDGVKQVLTETITDSCAIGSYPKCFTIERSDGSAMKIREFSGFLIVLRETSVSPENLEKQIDYDEPYYALKGHDFVQYFRPTKAVLEPIEGGEMKIFDGVRMVEDKGETTVQTPLGQKTALKVVDSIQMYGNLTTGGQTVDIIYTLGTTKYLVDTLGSVKDESYLTISLDDGTPLAVFATEKTLKKVTLAL